METAPRCVLEANVASVAIPTPIVALRFEQPRELDLMVGAEKGWESESAESLEVESSIGLAALSLASRLSRSRIKVGFAIDLSPRAALSLSQEQSCSSEQGCRLQPLAVAYRVAVAGTQNRRIAGERGDPAPYKKWD